MDTQLVLTQSSHIKINPTDPWSLDGMSRLRCTIEITLPAKDLGSVTEQIHLALGVLDVSESTYQC